MELGNTIDSGKLLHLFSVKTPENDDKVALTKTIFNVSGASQAAREAIQDYTKKALLTLDSIDIDEHRKVLLREFAEKLMERKV